MGMGFEILGSAVNAVLGPLASEWASDAAWLGAVGLVGYLHQEGRDVVADPVLSRALHEVRDDLKGDILSGEDPSEVLLTANGRLRKLEEGHQALNGLEARIVSAGDQFRFSHDGKTHLLETLLARECPRELTHGEKLGVVRTLRDYLGMNTAKIRSLVAALKRDGFPIRQWREIPDIVHTCTVLEVVKKYFPEEAGLTEILTRNRLFQKSNLDQATGFPKLGEFDTVIRCMMIRHRELFEAMPIGRIHLIQVIFYLDPDFRKIWHHLPRNAEDLGAAARTAIERAVRTVHAFENLPPSRRKFLTKRWEEYLPQLLAATEGAQYRLERLRKLPRDLRDAMAQMAQRRAMQLRDNFSTTESGNPWRSLMFFKHLMLQEMLKAYLDGLDPTDPKYRALVEPRIQRRLAAFALPASPRATTPASTEAIAWVEPWISLEPDPGQLTSGRQRLKEFGYQPLRVFELTASTADRLIRGGSYSAVLLPDGKILVALKTDESFMHLFFKLDREVEIGSWIDEDHMSELKEKIKEPLVGAAFEFTVDESGVMYLTNQSGTYKTPPHLMRNVEQAFQMKGLSFCLAKQWGE